MQNRKIYLGAGENKPRRGADIIKILIPPYERLCRIRSYRATSIPTHEHFQISACGPLNAKCLSSAIDLRPRIRLCRTLFPGAGKSLRTVELVRSPQATKPFSPWCFLSPSVNRTLRHELAFREHLLRRSKIAIGSSPTDRDIVASARLFS